jgi:hypothetical protein
LALLIELTKRTLSQR